MKLTSGPQQQADTRATTTIRSRLTGVVVVPSVILLVMWAVFSSYTVFDGIYLKAVASGVKDASIPGLNAFNALQRERQLTMAVLNTNNPDSVGLENQQRTTDRAVGELQTAMTELAANAPAEISVKVQALNDVLGPLEQRRAQVSGGTANADDIYRYYNSLLDAGSQLFDTQARITPDAVVQQEAMDAVDLFRASDQMSRASSIAAAAIGAGQFTPAQHVEFTSLVGSYRSTLATAAPTTVDPVREQLRALTTGETWERLAAAENRLVGAAPPRQDPDGEENTEPPSLPVGAADWQNVSSRVSDELLKITTEQSIAAVQLGLDRADQQFTEVIVGSLIALLAVVGGIVMAVRISRRLVNKALVTRLEQLKNDSLRLAHERLPTLVDRLRQGDRVDVAAEVPPLDYGTDEIGQVADAFNAAQYTAVAAAVKESQAREGVNRVFLGIAHRHQGLVHRQLKILDRMEREEENPEHLDSLFQLDHLATRARRNAENLIILAGEQPGRQWRKPVRLLDILRAAVAETEQYVRVRVNQVPDVSLHGVAVADTIHLVAELVDNAASFSPPRSQVEVYTSQVSGGVVVEIEDHGLGMTPEDRDQANRMLAHPPEFDAMALRGESRLGLFVVARLAARRSIRVELRESPYGGTVALVFLPADIVADTVESTSEPEPPSPRPRKPVERRQGTVPAAREPSSAAVLTQHAPPGRSHRWADDEQVEAQWPVEDEELPAHRVAAEENGAGLSPYRADLPSHEEHPPKPATNGNGGRPSLPRRQRQQNLAPQLRGEPLLPDWSDAVGPDDEEGSAERVRDTMSAFQRGTRQARDAEPGVES
ncbi:nitrate- and nitrite sensing domain-containing protein [Actinokineospora guangxiensis]|uniref:histidine kinase n=1 Tax=Actinokineospora guangxiensis TaxID=1490288 RepID=A0ABW0ET28_9PSEU